MLDIVFFERGGRVVVVGGGRRRRRGPFGMLNKKFSLFLLLPIVLCEQVAFFACVGRQERWRGCFFFCATCLPLVDKVRLATCLLVV